jgi:penicillin-binding protein 1B
MADFFAQVRSVVLKLALVGIAVTLFAAFYMDAWLIEKLNAQKWTLPAVVYARPLELFTGLAIHQEDVVRELQSAGYKNTQGGSGTYDVDGNALNIRLRAFRFWDGKQPAQTLRVDFNGGVVSGFRSNAGKAHGVRLEPMEIGRIHTESQEDRLLVSLKEVPQSLIDALIITEDRYFYSHHGISVRGILRAFFVNAKEGKVVEGASTLTQQLIKNFFLDADRSYLRKVQEIFLALLLELHVGKNDILEAYMNEVFVLQDGAKAIHGFGLASQYLFGLPVSSLNVEQSALLVAMLKGPSYYNPIRYPERALERRNLVISLLAQEGKLKPEEAKLVMGKPLGLLDRGELLASYPAYLDVVRRQLRRDYSSDALSLEGLRIFSNMDPQWQWRSQRELRSGVEQLEKKYGAKAQGMDGAVVVVDNATGDLMAVVGSKESRMAGFNRALDAKRPIGSLVKPAIYLTALQNGYNLQSRISDEPLSLKAAKGSWRPQNFDHQFHGEVPLYYALAKSYNVASVRLGMSVGLSKVINTLNKLGIEETLPQLPSLLLGAVEISPLSMAQAYSTIASKGFYTPIKSIQEITDNTGKPLKRYPLKVEQRFQPDVMHLLDYALRAVIREGTGSPVQKQFRADAHVAGKTGTTNDQRDSWFAGYDNNKLIVVWLGRDDNAPLPVTGGSGALPVWANIIAANPVIEGETNVPDNVHSIWIDKNTGHLSAETCEGAILVPYIEGTEPSEQADCVETAGAANPGNATGNIDSIDSTNSTTNTNNKVKEWFKKWFQ